MFTIRGATTILEDRPEEIQKAIEELLSAILQKNKLNKSDIKTILCSSTVDITSAYPAQFVRLYGFSHATLFSMPEPSIKGGLSYCIRLLIFVNFSMDIDRQLQSLVHDLEIASFMQNAKESTTLLKEIKDKLPVENKDISFTNKEDRKVEHVYLRGAKFLRTDLNRINIAIDGPAGSGKSSLAKMLADAVGIYYLDTGAMYRATTYFLLKNAVDIEDCNAVQKAVEKLSLEVKYCNKKQCIYIDEEEVDDKIRTPEIAMATATVAKNAYVRAKLIAIQRKIAEKYSCVVDGRDIGYNVLPNAQYKFFLTAKPEIRAERRALELKAKGQKVDFNQLLQDIILRDKQDAEREIAPLKMAEDAILIDSSTMTLQQVLQQVLQIIMQ